MAICARNRKTVSEIGDKFNIEENLRFTDFNELLKRDDIDAIHIVTPILEHAKQSIASLEAGKHTACTVPMATTMDDLKALRIQCRNMWYAMAPVQ